MSTKAQAKTQVKTPAAPAAARIPQHPVAVPEHEVERPDIAAQLEGAARLGHSLGAVGVVSPAPPIIQRQEMPEEEEEELQLKREPAAVQRQEQPEEEEEELMLKPDVQRVGAEGSPVAPEVEAAIQRTRGGGQPLESALQVHMSEALGHDFSGVRVHADSEADALNQQLSAKAFTTGPDIFFKRGAYDPGSSGGRELIAHELTHVGQPCRGRGRVSGSDKTARPAGDAYGKEAAAAIKDGSSSVQPNQCGVERKAGASEDWSSAWAKLSLQRPDRNWSMQRQVAARRGGDGALPIHEATGVRGTRDQGAGRLVPGGVPKRTLEANNRDLRAPAAVSYGSTPQSGPLETVTRVGGPEAGYHVVGQPTPATWQQVNNQDTSWGGTEEVHGTTNIVRQAAVPRVVIAYTRRGLSLYARLGTQPSAEPDSESYYVRAGSHPTGMRTPGVLSFEIYRNYTRGISDLIRRGEQEHCNDIQHVYDRTLGGLSAVIQREFQGRVFGPRLTRGRLRQDITTELDREIWLDPRTAYKPQLAQWVMADPASLRQWYTALTNKTRERDNRGWHTLTGTRPRVVQKSGAQVSMVDVVPADSTEIGPTDSRHLYPELE